MLKAIRGDVSEGVAPEVTQAFGDQEQNNRPADQETEGVNQSVVAGGVDQRRNTEEGGGRHKVAGNRQPVLKAGNISARGIVIAA